MEAWNNIWSSGIEVGGNLGLAQAINSSLYYILSSVRPDWPHRFFISFIAPFLFLCLHKAVVCRQEDWQVMVIMDILSGIARLGCSLLYFSFIPIWHNPFCSI